MSIQELLEEGDTGEAILGLPAARPANEPKVNGRGAHADRDGSERPHRYDQCDDTCTTDCGHRKGAGAPRPNTPSTESAANRGAEDSVPTINEYRTEWGVMFHDGSVRRGFNGRTARVRATLEAQRLAELYAPDNIRLVSRPVFVGEWVEQA